jgi:hypothetical protein
MQREVHEIQIMAGKTGWQVGFESTYLTHQLGKVKPKHNSASDLIQPT